MDDHTQALVEQLKIQLAGIQTDEIADLIHHAKVEALAEAQSILRDAILQAILVQVLDELQGKSSERAMSPRAVPADASSTAADADQPPESDERIRQEIEAIRRQIAENNALLNQAQAPSPATTAAQGPIANGKSKPAVGNEVTERAPAAATGETADIGDESGCGYYVYGIVDQPLDGLPEQGIDPGYAVQAVAHKGIWAIVSRVSLDEFNQETLEAKVNDLDWLEEKVRQHQEILEVTMAGPSASSPTGCTCVPMKFCTIYRTEARMSEMLTAYYEDLVDALAKLAGKQEWGVKLYYDDSVLAQRAGEVSKRVKTLKRRISEKSEGAAYFLKKQLEGTIADEVERISDEWAQRSYDRLAAHAVEAVVNPLHGKEFTGRGETMILNSAYLVKDEQLPAFRAELDSLNAQCGDLGFRYEYTGPWPAYNFVNIGTGEGVDQ